MTKSIKFMYSRLKNKVPKIKASQCLIKHTIRFLLK